MPGLPLPSPVRAGSGAQGGPYAQADALLVERNSQRRIVRATGVARTTIAKRLKKASAPALPLPRLRPKKAQKKRWKALELGELWSFVGHKRRKAWPWLAVEWASRRIVAWTLPRHYRCHCWYFTDQWKTYATDLPRWQHGPCPKGEGQTSLVEAINCSLRQRCGALVRKSCPFSKSLAMHNAQIRIVIDNHNCILK